MKVEVILSKVSLKSRIISSVGDVIGIMVVFLFLFIFGVFHLIGKLAGKNVLDGKKRTIRPFKDMELDWKLYAERDNFKLYEAFIGEWPQELDFIDFHQGDEYVKVYRSEPEIEELNHLFVGTFYSYDLENNLLEFHDGFYFIAYPQRENPNDYSLFHLNYKELKLSKVKDDIHGVDRVNKSEDGILKIITKSYDTIETIRITR